MYITDITQEAAALAAVLSAAIIGLAIGTVPAIVRDFEQRYKALTTRQKTDTARLGFLLLFLALIPYLASTAIGSKWPQHFLPAVVFSLLFIGGTYSLAFVSRKLGAKKKEQRKGKTKMMVDWRAFLSLSSLLFFLCTVLVGLVALVGVSSIALRIYLGGYQYENFIFGLFSLYWSVFFFAVAMLYFVTVVVWDRIVPIWHEVVQKNDENTSGSETSDQEIGSLQRGKTLRR